MLKRASDYSKELCELFVSHWHKSKYKYIFYNTGSYLECISKSANFNNTKTQHHFVSIHDGKIIGYISYNISLFDNRVYKLNIVNFTDNIITFGVDVKRVIVDIFELYRFRKINFTVFVGNPIEKAYDKIVKSYNGRVVGVKKKHTKLIDKQYYDVKEYEVFREDYLMTKIKRGKRNEQD